MNLTDTHCHLDMIPDEKIVLLRAKEAGVTTIINVGTSVDASKKSIEIAQGTDLVDVFATCGIHAQEGTKDIKKYGNHRPVILGSETTPESDSGQALRLHSGQLRGSELYRTARMTGLAACMDELRKVAQSSKKVVAIGECGMDYFEVNSDKGKVTSQKERREQRQLFEAQVKLAKELDLPLIIHCRNAWEDTFRLLSIVDRQSTLKGLFHSWTGTVEQAKRALDLGFYISFSGIVTFKNSGEIPQVAKMVPEGRILVETDSPFLSPVPLRGKQNEPKNVRITAQFLAQLRGVSLERIAEITSRNARKLFKLANN